MSRSIGFLLYRLERASDGITNVVAATFPTVILSDDIMTVNPVNVAGGQDLVGIPYLYSKITLQQPGLGQELFVMNSVLDIKTQINA